MTELTLMALGAALIILIAAQRIENAAVKRARNFKRPFAAHRSVVFRGAHKNFVQRRKQLSKMAAYFEQAHGGTEGNVITRKRP